MASGDGDIAHCCASLADERTTEYPGFAFSELHRPGGQACWVTGSSAPVHCPDLPATCCQALTRGQAARPVDPVTAVPPCSFKGGPARNVGLMTSSRPG